MSYQDGWSAIHLQMPPRVPRTEYSAESHWDLLQAATGMEVDADSPPAQRLAARREFFRRWNFGLVWSTLVGGGVLEACRSYMGHDEYAAGGTDRSDRVSCPFTGVDQILRFDPWEAYGPIDRREWIGRFERHYAAQCDAWPDCVNMTGVYITLVSGLIDIFGWQMLLTALGEDPAGFGRVAERYASWVEQFFHALGEADVPVVMVHDDIVWTGGPFVHPDWYRRFVFPAYRRLFEPLVGSGKRIAFTSDGNWTQFIDDVAAAGVHGFVMEPMTDMACVARRYGRTHFFVGNADTRVLLGGSHADIRAEVERCMAIGKECPGFFMAVGNHIPPNTPVESALYYNEVYERLSRR
ncbi:MAG: hypothetical protein BIFFINMI_00359 [Phycisphaerae bacterium]|nr:hypothetical protein [Phycisphaerae bacterium]